MRTRRLGTIVLIARFWSSDARTRAPASAPTATAATELRARTRPTHQARESFTVHEYAWDTRALQARSFHQQRKVARGAGSRSVPRHGRQGLSQKCVRLRRALDGNAEKKAVLSQAPRLH